MGAFVMWKCGLEEIEISAEVLPVINSSIEQVKHEIELKRPSYWKDACRFTVPKCFSSVSFYKIIY
ncbi:hypothetical protein [Bacillus subtilis]|uniref:hypothetical protein n=1 Tax=Bacillus subtilis TaxID=1423 RepID=UPI003F4BD9C6